MNGKDKDEAATRQLIEGLDGIYVREYEFDKEGAVLDGADRAAPQVLRDQRVVADRARARAQERRDHRRDGEDGQRRDRTACSFLTAEPKELTIVLILGPIRMDELGKLKGLGGLSALGDIEKNAKSKDKEKGKEKDKTGGSQ